MTFVRHINKLVVILSRKTKKTYEENLFFTNIINILFLQFYQNKRDRNGFNSRFDW